MTLCVIHTVYYHRIDNKVLNHTRALTDFERSKKVRKALSPFERRPFRRSKETVLKAQMTLKFEKTNTLNVLF